MIPTSVPWVQVRHAGVEILHIGIPVLQPAARDKMHEGNLWETKKDKKRKNTKELRGQKAWKENHGTSDGDEILGFNKIISVALKLPAYDGSQIIPLSYMPKAQRKYHFLQKKKMPLVLWMGLGEVCSHLKWLLLT